MYNSFRKMHALNFVAYSYLHYSVCFAFIVYDLLFRNHISKLKFLIQNRFETVTAVILPKFVPIGCSTRAYYHELKTLIAVIKINIDLHR